MDKEMSPLQKAAIERASAPLNIGQELSNGGVVLKFNYRAHRGGEAVGEHGIVLCLLASNPWDRFVVWRYVKHAYGDLHILAGQVVCMHGDYVQSLDEAMKIFNERTERGI